MSVRRSCGIRILLIALAAGGCASSGGGGTSDGGVPSQPEPRTSEGLSNAEMEAIYEARIAASRNRFTPADVHFMTGMIHHHAQAIEISRLVPDRASSSSIEILASRIINSQNDEIAIMQRWLADRGQPVPEVHVTEGGVMVHGGGDARGHSMHSMPGMLTADQIRELAGSRGSAFDRLFLELMIEHHLGAVTMVRELIATDGAVQDEDVFRFASDVHVDQATEVARMERMLAALPESENPR